MDAIKEAMIKAEYDGDIDPVAQSRILVPRLTDCIHFPDQRRCGVCGMDRDNDGLLQALHSRDDEIKRLRSWLTRIKAINDHPGRYSVHTDEACDAALDGRPLS